MTSKIRLFKLWPALTALVFVMQAAHPAKATTCSGDIYSGGNGHDVPTPFEDVNRRFELADGEIYALPGNLVSKSPLTNDDSSTQAYFAVEMEKYSWLTNSKRAEYRYYPLLISNYERVRASVMSGTLLCRAHGKIVKGRNGKQYQVFLEPIY